MNIKRILSAALTSVIAGTTLVSCSQPNAQTLLSFNDEDSGKYTSAVEGSALTLYVDGKVETSGDGSEVSPFKTIPEAQAKIRELKAGEGLPAGGVTVLVRDGEYKITESLTFTEEDSGTAESPITYVSESEFGAVLTGGLILSANDFEPLSAEEKSRLLDDTAKEKVVKVDLTKYGLTESDWGKLYSYGSYILRSQYDDGVGPASSELFINGERQTLSRYPNEGFIYTDKLIDTGIAVEYFTDTEFDCRGENTYVPENGNIRNPQGGIFTVNETVRERISQWTSYDDIWTFGYYKWSWADAAPPVKTIDAESGTVELGQAVSYGVSSKAPFYFFNVFDELDTEGEFYIDRINGILYVYKSEDFDSAEIMMSCSLDNIVTATNVSYLTLKGFSACATRSNGFVMSGNDFVVDNCLIYNIRGNAISANGTNITVQNCEIKHIGSGCISVSGGDNANLTKGNNLVYNNYIHNWSEVDRTYKTAVSVGGCGNTVSHNEIANAPHMAIGWSGAYQVIEYNEIYNVCTETSDCGAIYSGRNYNSYGSVMRYNYIHDVGSGKALALGIYWDDGLSGQTAYGNIIVNSASSAFLIGGGRDNVVENNIIINAGSDPITYDARSRDGIINDGWVKPETVITQTANITATVNETWIAAFPGYDKLIPYTEDFSGDYDDPLFAPNPANCSVKNNISYYFSDDIIKPVKAFTTHNIDEAVYQFSDVKDNPILLNGISDFPGYNNGDYTITENSKAKELCPDFEPIPFDEIGRVD